MNNCHLIHSIVHWLSVRVVFERGAIRTWASIVLNSVPAGKRKTPRNDIFTQNAHNLCRSDHRKNGTKNRASDSERDYLPKYPFSFINIKFILKDDFIIHKILSVTHRHRHHHSRDCVSEHCHDIPMTLFECKPTAQFIQCRQIYFVWKWKKKKKKKTREKRSERKGDATRRMASAVLCLFLSSSCSASSSSSSSSCTSSIGRRRR